MPHVINVSLTSEQKCPALLNFIAHIIIIHIA